MFSQRVPRLKIVNSSGEFKTERSSYSSQQFVPFNKLDLLTPINAPKYRQSHREFATAEKSGKKDSWQNQSTQSIDRKSVVLPYLSRTKVSAFGTRFSKLQSTHQQSMSTTVHNVPSLE